MADDFLFWMVWGLSIAVCGWNFFEGWRNPQRMLEWPFLCGLICLYFFGYMAMCAFVELRYAFSTYDAIISQFLVLACLMAINFGWKSGRSANVNVAVTEQYAHHKVWIIGLGLILVATAVHFSFHGFSLNTRVSGLHYRSSTAYWYMFFWVGYPGLAMSIWALCKMSRSDRRKLMVVSVIAFVIFIAPHLATARRGPLYPAVVIILFVPAFSFRKKPNPIWITSGLVIAGLVMLAFVQARNFIYNEKGWADAFNSINLTEVVRTKVSQTGDNEYVNHVYFVGTLSETGKFQYGTGHLSLLVHWIPRKIWRNKPTLGEGYFWKGQLFNDLNRHAGYGAFGGGAAAGGFADSFLQYGYMTPLFWFLLSYFFARRYVNAAVSDNPQHLFFYIAVPSVSHWLLSQGFAAAFVPFLIFITVPVLVLRFAKQPLVEVDDVLDEPAYTHHLQSLSRAAQ